MPFDHFFEEEHCLLVIRGYGAGSMEETADSASHAIRFVTHSETSSRYRVLILVDGIALTPTLEETQTILQFIVLFQSYLRGPIAIVASTTNRLTTAFLIAAYSSDSNGEVRAFETEIAARAWLLAQNIT